MNPLVFQFIRWSWAALGLYWLISAFFAKRTLERQSYGSRAFTLGLVAIVILLLTGPLHVHVDQSILPRTMAFGIAGDCVVFIGLALAIWSRTVLGRNWSATITFKEGHELIENGPYRYLRHPIYTGCLLMLLGGVIAIGRIVDFVALTICFVALWQKLRREETLMARHFPTTYPQYKTRTWALIPFLL
jgi:protein-S-isoprenylcysteine O-methyltransferase Ste14